MRASQAPRGETGGLASRRKFDIVMAWAIDRLGRSLIDLLDTIEPAAQGCWRHERWPLIDGLGVEAGCRSPRRSTSSRGNGS
jgi:hypothetical protein